MDSQCWPLQNYISSQWSVTQSLIIRAHLLIRCLATVSPNPTPSIIYTPSRPSPYLTPRNCLRNRELSHTPPRARAVLPNNTIPRVNAERSILQHNDMWSQDVRRFADLHNNREFLRSRVKETTGAVTNCAGPDIEYKCVVHVLILSYHLSIWQLLCSLIIHHFVILVFTHCENNMLFV